MDIGVRASATWNTSVALKKNGCGIFTGASRSPCELVTVATSTSFAVLWNFVGLWHVAVVHRFHCRSDVSRGNERVSLPRRLLAATVAAGVYRASQLALSSEFLTRVVLVCGLTRKLTKRKCAPFEKRCLEARTNMPQVCTHPKQNVPQEHREGGASHGYVGHVGGATPRLV